MFKELKGRIRKNGIAYLLLSPSFAVLLFFFVGPIIYAFYMSLHSWSLMGSSKFVGFQNYLDFARDEMFLEALVNTVFYSAMFVFPVTVISLCVALLVNKGIKFKNLFRSMMFVPVISSFIIAAVIWTWIYHYDYGVINWLMSLIGLDKVLWLGSRSTALPSIVLMSIWKGFGYYMVLFLAGLQSIPHIYYEAAQIDGATQLQLFRHITFPLLKPIVLVVVILSTIFSFQVFDAIFIMTKGGPAWSTATLTWMIYVEAFLAYRMGFASAIGFVLFAMILIVSVFELKYIRSGRTTY